MTTKELSAACGFAPAVEAETREIAGIFTGDLLSWAMGRAKEGDAWFTVMGNVNAVAVAALADCACIVLCHGAALDAVAKTRAEEQGINIFTTDLPEFEAGFALANAWCYGLGVLIALLMPNAPSMMAAVLMVQGGLVALALILLDEIDNAYGDTYSGALSAHSLLPGWPVRRCLR